MRLRVARKVLRQNYYREPYRRTTLDAAYARITVADTLALRHWRHPRFILPMRV